MSATITGRPRDPRLDAALREHLVAMLAERGPDGFSVDDLAARSQVSKAAIYRRYRSRDDLILAGFAAVNETMPDVEELPVRQALVSFLEWVTGAIASAMTASWIVAMQQRPELHALYRSRVVAPRRAALLGILRRGQRAGLIEPAADLDVLLTCLSAPAILAGMHRDGSHPSAHVTAGDVVDTVMAGVLTPTARANGW